VFVLEEPAEVQKGGQERKAVPQEYAAVMERWGSKALCAYSTTGTYTEGQYIMHPKFGEGYVLATSRPRSRWRCFLRTTSACSCAAVVRL